MSLQENQTVEALRERLRKEIKTRQALERELIHALRAQTSLRKEVTLLRKILNARSVPDFVALAALRRARTIARQGPQAFANKALRASRRRAGAVKRKVLRSGNK